MSRRFLVAFASVAAVCAWWVLVVVMISEGWLKAPLTSSRSPAAFIAAAEDMAAAGHVGNLSMFLLEDGETAATLYMSSGHAVDGASLYQVASLSKWLAAWGVMVLVEDGAIELDAPVSAYLTRWQLPASEFDVSGVTVRRLLSHTAGLDDGLGYQGFATQAEVQALEASLSQALDASPGSSGVARLGHPPGSEWSYSGGGYTLLQLLVEEVSGQDFAAFMAARVFQPLGMKRTTFDHAEAISMGLAENFGPNGTTEALRWYTALAAASLFTSAEDLATFLQAQASVDGQPVLSAETLALMRTPHAARMGADIWGLGVMLYAPNGEGDFIIGHDGSNEPAINTAARLDPDTGDGIVVLETGSALLASELAGEWVFWKTGEIDNLAFVMATGRIKSWGGVGTLVILALGAWRCRKR